MHLQAQAAVSVNSEELSSVCRGGWRRLELIQVKLIDTFAHHMGRSEAGAAKKAANWIQLHLDRFGSPVCALVMLSIYVSKYIVVAILTG